MCTCTESKPVNFFLYYYFVYFKKNSCWTHLSNLFFLIICLFLITHTDIVPSFPLFLDGFVFPAKNARRTNAPNTLNVIRRDGHPRRVDV